MATTNFCSSNRNISDIYNRDFKNNHYYVHDDGSIRLEKLEIIATRSSSSDPTVNLQINTQIHKYGTYGTGLWLVLEVLTPNEEHITVYNDAACTSERNINNYNTFQPGNRNAIILSNAAVGASTTTETDTVYCRISSTSSSYGIRFRIWCNAIQVFGSCTDDLNHGWSTSGVQSYYVFNSNNVTLPDYVQPNTPPTQWRVIDLNYTGDRITDLIKRKEEPARKIHYQIEGGTDTIDWVAIQLYPSNITWEKDEWRYIPQAVQNSLLYESATYPRDEQGQLMSYIDKLDYFSVASSPNIQSGKSYNIAIKFQPVHNEIMLSSGYKTIYVYQKPTLTGVTATQTEINANQSVSYTLDGINDRAFTGTLVVNNQNYQLEAPFRTYYRYNIGSTPNTNWINYDTNTTLQWSASDIRSIIPYSEQNDGNTIYIQFKRNSPSSGEDTSTITKQLTVYYRPRNGITTCNLKMNNSSGTNINIGGTVIGGRNFTGVYTYWNYNSTLATSGYTQGYRIRLYDENDNLVKKADGVTDAIYYTQGTETNITIPKEDIPKGQLSKIDITPYYKNNEVDPNNFIYYNGVIQKINFIKLVAPLEPPVIDFPQNQSKWINKDLRIGFVLPEDEDYSTIGSTYRYDNIEVQIDNTYTVRFADTTGITTTGTTLQSTACFSTIDLEYRKAIVVYPVLAFPNVLSNGNHTLRVRVKKQYYNDIVFTGWSDWSSLITITIYNPTYTVNTGDKILASHYNRNIRLC